jgi:hypothetical protein
MVVGLARRTLAPWHRNIREDDVASATRAALAGAGADGVGLRRTVGGWPWRGLPATPARSAG